MKKLYDWAYQHQVVATVVVLFVYAVGIITLATNLDRLSCTNRWDGVYQSQYKVLGGCRVNIEGHWLPENVIRVVK